MSRISPRSKKVIEENGLTIRFNRHPLRKNNIQVAEMYDCYRDGMSLAKIAKLYTWSGKKMTRQAVFDVFKSRGYRLRSKKFKGLQELDGIRFTLTKGGHLRGTLPDKRRVLMHWYVWEKHNGPVPAGHCIFHKDRNPANNSLENLELLPKSQMAYVFNPSGKNQFTKLQYAQ